MHLALRLLDDLITLLKHALGVFKFLLALSALLLVMLKFALEVRAELLQSGLFHLGADVRVAHSWLVDLQGCVHKVAVQLLDLLLELLESFCLLVFVLVEALPVSLNLLHLVLELLNDLLGGGERLLSEQELLLEDRLTLLRLCHLVPEIRIVGQLLLH